MILSCFPSCSSFTTAKPQITSLVAVQELGAAVQDDVAAKIQRALQVGGHEGVVDDGKKAALRGQCHGSRADR